MRCVALNPMNGWEQVVQLIGCYQRCRQGQQCWSLGGCMYTHRAQGVSTHCFQPGLLRPTGDSI
jgi:hypothetical protein